jgi:purine-binding chemotaxis protein CheW
MTHTGRLAQETKGIDWAELHRRISALETSLTQGALPRPEEQDRILQERARALSERPEEERHGANELEFVAFALGEERYGIESVYLREVLMFPTITPLPTSPLWVAGLINLRGQIVSVVDLKRLFGLPDGAAEKARPVLLLNGGMEFGLVADAVLGIGQVSLGALQPSLGTLAGARNEYVKGITPERVALLDGAKLLSDPKLVVHEEVQA